MLVHPEAIVHGLVQWSDGAVTAGLALPDMKVPIANALRHHERLRMDLPRLDLAAIGRLSFERPDEARFPCLSLAKAALQAGGAMPTILNAANEIAVEAYMAGHIGFYAISEIVESVCSTFSGRKIAAPATVSDALAIDEEARAGGARLIPAYAESTRLARARERDDDGLACNDQRRDGILSPHPDLLPRGSLGCRLHPRVRPLLGRTAAAASG